ncbi:MAG: tetratricopeptide repeat protein [Planctomycetaceae bacterium]|nr:tetratricopeptide repeat protein [Planctomycetaceae bacterium]
MLPATVVMVTMMIALCTSRQAAAQHLVGVPMQQQAATPSVVRSEARQIRFEDPLVRFLGVSQNQESQQDDKFDTISISRKNNAGGSVPYYSFALNIPNKLERDMLNDSADGRWERWDIVSASLVAEGMTDPAKIAGYQSKIDAVVRNLRKQTASLPQTEWPQVVFETLHRDLLTGKYDITCTDLAQSLDTGRFNCVSATVLFHTLAQRMGLDVCGLEMRGHALSRVRVGGEPVDLETTCAEWFKIRNSEKYSNENSPKRLTLAEQQQRKYDTADRAASRAASRNTIGASVADEAPALSPEVSSPETLRPGSVPRSLREVNDVQLVATIYYNQGVDDLTSSRFGKAVLENVKALQLDPQNDNAWRNLLATLNNWAIERASKEDYLSAAQLLDEGILLDPQYELFRSNQVHTYYHWIFSTAKKQDYQTAFAICQVAEERLPNQPNLRYLNFSIRRKLASEYLAAREDRKAFEQYDLATTIAPKDINVFEAEVRDVTKYAEQMVEQNDMFRAVSVIDQVMARYHALNRRQTRSTTVLPEPVLPEPPTTTFTTMASPVATSTASSHDSPLFAAPVVLENASGISDRQHQITVQPVGETPVFPTAYAAARPIFSFVKTPLEANLAVSPVVPPELMTRMQELRVDASVAWAAESLEQKQFAEAVRRLTFGNPDAGQFDVKQTELLRQAYSDWIASLQAEHRSADARAVLKMRDDSPYLK